ncbi:MAG: hypothetical protein N2112_15755 [Gemmataceae bacterium]|jgi:beta-lactamase regulating signal transducer with metallopeptidase domain|nr:hypothetical protein [Gemmataceae bacterium]
MTHWLLENAVYAGLLALVVAAGISLTKPHPAVRHAFWLLVLLRLVLPPVPQLSIGLANFLVQPQAIVAETISGPQTTSESGTIELPQTIGLTLNEAMPFDRVHSEERVVLALRDLYFETEVNEAIVNPSPTVAETSTIETRVEPERELVTEGQPMPDEPTRVSWWDLLKLAGVLWLIGTIIFSLRFFLGVHRFQSYWRRNRKEAPTWLVSEVRQVAGELRIPPPRVEMVRGLTSPMVWCWNRPHLLWPSELTELSPEARRAVVFHELAHIRRKDHWVRRLESLAGMLHWWNPVFWITRRKLRTNAEFACDAWATQNTDKRVFAEALLSVCAFNPQRRPAPAVAAVSESRRDLEERLTMILKGSPSGRLRFRTKFLFALVACAALPTWSLGEGVPFQIILEPAPLTNEVKGEKKDVLFFVVDKNAPTANKEIEELEAKIKELNNRLAKLKEEAAKKPAVKDVLIEKPVVAPLETLYRKVEKKGPDGKIIVTYEPVPLPKTGETPMKIVTGDMAQINPKEGTVRVIANMNKFLPVENTIILSRTTYKLPANKVPELTTILNKFKTSVLEITSNNDTVTVTTTPEIQATVAGIVKLLTPAPTGSIKMIIDPKESPKKPEGNDPKPAVKPEKPEKPEKPTPPEKPEKPEKPTPPAPPAKPEKPAAGLGLEQIDDLLKKIEGDLNLNEKTKRELMKAIQEALGDKMKFALEAQQKALEAEKKAKEIMELPFLKRIIADAEKQKKAQEELDKKKSGEKGTEQKPSDEKKRLEELKKLEAELERKIREFEKK